MEELDASQSKRNYKLKRMHDLCDYVQKVGQRVMNQNPFHSKYCQDIIAGAT